jgi:hypothetical protein
MDFRFQIYNFEFTISFFKKLKGKFRILDFQFGISNFVFLFLSSSF